MQVPVVFQELPLPWTRRAQTFSVYEAKAKALFDKVDDFDARVEDFFKRYEAAVTYKEDAA
jgi:hypothetical protein